jgi:hypothetical protein
VDQEYDSISLLERSSDTGKERVKRLIEATENFPFPPGEEFRGAAQRRREIEDRVISNGFEQLAQARRKREAEQGE